MTIHTTSTKCQYSPVISTVIALARPSFPCSARTHSVRSHSTPTVTCAPCVPVRTKKVQPNRFVPIVRPLWTNSELQHLPAQEHEPEQRRRKQPDLPPLQVAALHGGQREHHHQARHEQVEGADRGEGDIQDLGGIRPHDALPLVHEIGRDERPEQQALRADEGPERHLAVVEPHAGMRAHHTSKGSNAQPYTPVIRSATPANAIHSVCVSGASARTGRANAATMGHHDPPGTWIGSGGVAGGSCIGP